MTGLDTNLVLRFLLRDDPKQSPKAQRVVNSLSGRNPGWIALATILEVAWVMKSKNRASRAQTADVLEALLAVDAIVVERSEILARAIQRFRSCRAGFVDCLIAESAAAAGCARILTFDEIAARDLGMELVRA